MDISGVLEILDDHGFEDLSTTFKVELINETYWDLAEIEPWPFLEKVVLLDFDGTDPAPTNIPSDYSTVKFARRVENQVPLDPADYDDLLWGRYDLTTAGDPTMYYFVGTELRFYPVPPSGSDLVELHYHCFPAELTANTVEADILLPARFHSLLWLGPLVALYMRDDDPDMAASYQTLYDRASARMRTALWRRQIQRPQAIRMVEEVEFFDNPTINWD
jgi:hypothetical protein